MMMMWILSWPEKRTMPIERGAMIGRSRRISWLYTSSPSASSVFVVDGNATKTQSKRGWMMHETKSELTTHAYGARGHRDSETSSSAASHLMRQLSDQGPWLSHPGHDEDDDNMDDDDDGQWTIWTMMTRRRRIQTFRWETFVTAPDISSAFTDCLAVWFSLPQNTNASKDNVSNRDVSNVEPGIGQILMADWLLSCCTLQM
jgi:hypothetical protein